jgi:hypothetical protein
MADITPQQAQQLQAIAAQVEVAWQNITKAKTALSYLMQAGKATCTDVKTYNLLAKGTYYYQKSMADTIRGAGGQAPDIHPPMYVAWKGRTGDAAVMVDCTQAGMSGWTPTGMGDFFVNPHQVEWRNEAMPSDVDALRQTLGRVSFADRPPANLGYVGLIIALIVGGVVLSVLGYIALKIAEVLGDLPQKQEYTKQMAITAERHRATLDARAKCLSDCENAGKDPIACAKSCAKVLPDFAPPSAGGGMGIIGWALGGALVIGLGYLGYRAWSGGWHHGLVPGTDGVDGSDDGYDGADDGDEYADAIDADFIERVV